MIDKEHTPLPWKYEYGNWSQKYCIKISLDGRRVPIADVHEEANAKLIIEAVNNHDRLLRENKRLREALTESDRVIRKYGDNGWKFGQRALELNKSLLAKSGDRHE